VTRRIARAILAVAVFAVIALALPLAYAANRFYHDEEILRLERAATLATRDVSADSMTGSDPIELPPAGESIRVAIYDPSGALIAGDGPAVADELVVRAAGGQIADGSVGADLVVAVPITQEETPVAIVRAAVANDLVVDRVERAWLALAAIGTGVVLVAALLAVVEGRRLGRPVKRLSRAASRLGDGDFTVTVEPSGVAEIDDAGRAIEATAVRLGAVLSRERAFSSDASHQLRTPLTALRLRLETALAKRGPVDHQMIRQSLEDIDRLQTTVDDLLALARDTTGSDHRVAAVGVLEDVERAWHGPLAAVGRPLRLRIDQRVQSIAFSEPALRQVLEVLMSNASEHGRGAVTLGARRVGGGVAIDVDDEGQVPEGDLERLFLRRSPEASGSGIGLALARSLAEAEGARLIATSHAGRTRLSLFTTAD
jgi:signal transduction histidine kinase